MEVLEFIEKHRDYLNIKNIERDAGMGNGLLSKILKGERSLSVDNACKLRDVLSVFNAKLSTPIPKPSGEWKQVNDIYRYEKKGDYYERDGVLYDKKYAGGCFYVMPLK